MNAPNPPAAPDDWITNPDLALPLSHPLRAGIIKRLPAPDICVVDRPLPALPGEVRQVNDTYLEVASRAVKDRGGMAFLAVFGSLITLAVLSGLVWVSFQDDLADYTWLLVVMGVLSVLHTSMVYPPWTTAFFAPAYEPIRFCRRTRKVYCYRAWCGRWGGMDVYRFGKREIRVYDWGQCRAELVYIRNRYYLSNMDTMLQLVLLDPQTNDVIERFPIGERDETRDFSKRVFLWETIRRYMEAGTADIPPPVPQQRCETLGDYIEAFNPFSMPARFNSPAGRVFGHAARALMWLLLLPLLALVIFNWLARKAERKIDWGEFEMTVLHPELAVSGISQERQRRKIAARYWLASVVLQIALVGWLFANRAQ